MTFEYTAEQRDVRDRARTFSEGPLAAAAADIDRPGSRVPDDLAGQMAGLIGNPADPVLLAIACEELAVSSGAAALAAIAGDPREPHAYAGLRGATVPPDAASTQLALAAVALGLGRGALDAALAELRRSTNTPGQDEKPHWVAADVATELDAARLVTLHAAQAVARGGGEVEVALARLLATSASRSAVDAALRIAGPEGYREGSVLERLARDVRAASLVLGTEERLRAAAADGMFSSD